MMKKMLQKKSPSQWSNYLDEAYRDEREGTFIIRE